MNGKGKTGRWGRIRSRKNKQSQQPEKQTNIRTFYTAASNRFWQLILQAGPKHKTPLRSILRRVMQQVAKKVIKKKISTCNLIID